MNFGAFLYFCVTTTKKKNENQPTTKNESESKRMGDARIFTEILCEPIK